MICVPRPARPRPIDTPILGKTMPKDAADQTLLELRERNPMKRLGHPEEVAFLAFEATHTTGAELSGDGGASQL